MNAVVLVWLALSMIWGSTWLFIKLGLRDLPPFTFAGIRFLLASAILSVVILIRRQRLPRDPRDWQFIALTGFLSVTINFALVFWGGQYVSSGLSALLNATTPFFGLFVAHHYLPNERITPAKSGGAFLGILGVGFIFSDQLSLQGALSLIACAGIVIGAFIVAFSNVLIKMRGKHIDPVILSAGQMVFGFPPLLLIGMLAERNLFELKWTPVAIFSLVYLAVIGSCIAFILYFWLLKKIPVTKALSLLLVTPLVAVTLGKILNSEELTWRILVGGACIISGVGAIILWQTKKIFSPQLAKSAASHRRWQEAEPSYEH
jgi:drug/metabolite transporter (DMT)-like permease